MSQIDEVVTQSGTAEGQGDSDDVRLVPVAESIRYRKRAQGAERKAEVLAEELAVARAEAGRLGEQVEQMRTEHALMSRLAAEGAKDLEAAVLIAKARLGTCEEAGSTGSPQADVESVIKQLKNEKRYLFGEFGGGATLQKTSGAKERLGSREAVVDRAAKKAAVTGSRADVQEYMRRRRGIR